MPHAILRLLACAVTSGTVVACASSAAAPVRPGVDVLLRDSVHLIAGRRIGLLTNQTAVDAAGLPTPDRLARERRARLVALFAPEHHFAVALRPGETFGDTVDAATGLPIYSLYGANRAPTPAQLARLEVLVVDVQDVGARTFTYVSTAVLAMRAAAAAGRRVIVLDRPNPIGCEVQGPVLDAAHASFIGLLPVPLRHGMTVGELLRFANTELGIGADLVVVPVSGWRCEWFDATGLPWVRPSPNLPDLASVAWYPGTVLLEATNLSVGRGSDAPFRQVGAPWLDAEQVAGLARGAGLRVEPVRFTPRQPGDEKYGDVPLAGVRFAPFDREAGDPIRDALRLLAIVARVHPESLSVDSVGLARRLGVPYAPGRDSWPDEIRAFRARAARYLLYPRP